jgi:YVTN family beta-propeller protein
MALLPRGNLKNAKRLIGSTMLLSAFAFILLDARHGSTNAENTNDVYHHPTTSSPISLSADNRLVWAVNSDDDSVSVIRTDHNTVIAKIDVGDEPQSVALDPANKFAYVANAASNNITVIKITNSNPDHFSAEVDKSVGKGGHFITGAEPWNIVVSPDGKRVFVANSGQDTITVIDTDADKDKDKDGDRDDDKDDDKDKHGNRNNDRDHDDDKDKDGKKNNDKIRIIGHVDLRKSVCNDPDRERRFQPRGLAVTEDSSKLYVTRFFSYTKPGGKQVDDNGREGLVCRLDIDTNSKKIKDYQPVGATTLASQVTGFTVDSDQDGDQDNTSAHPNQLQSIVIRGNSAYLPNIAASPQGPQLFNVTNQAFVNKIDGVNGSTQSDDGALNLNLGARNPEGDKIRLFFANPWGIAFTNQSGEGAAYAISAASDLLVKVNVAGDGELSFTVDGDTTRYIDLNDPDNPATSGVNAGKNPIGIVITDNGDTAYVTNFVSRNMSVVDLNTDTVVKVIKTTDLPPAGSQDERTQVGAEMFFSSRGNFNLPAGANANFSTRNRLSQEGWQACSTCHFVGLTDSIVWAFGTGPRKSVPLNGSFNPHNPDQQRVFNYSVIFDQVQDFEGNIRDTSGPGPLPAAAAVPCDGGAQTSTFRATHGLLLGVGNVNNPPCVIDRFNPSNEGRAELTVNLPGSNVAVPALTSLKEWVQFAIRTPNGPLTTLELQGGVSAGQIFAGRLLFQAAGCATCHGGQQWTSSIKDFVSPPDPNDLFTEREPPFTDNPVGAQYIDRFLRDIKSFNLGVAGQGNPIGNNIGGPEKTAAAGLVVAAQDGLGRDYSLQGSRSFGKGIGFNPPSLLGIGLLPPYYHNGACETLECVLTDVNHRTAGQKLPFDILNNPQARARVVKFLESIDAQTTPISGN